MGGLAVLLIIAAYIGIACALVYKIKPRKWKVVVVVAAILLPTADAVVGRLYLKHLCATEAGLKVHRVVENVDGFLDLTPHEIWVKKHGYKFVEGNARSSGRVDRVLLRDGKVINELNVPPISLYRRLRLRIGEGGYIERNQNIVEVIQTSEILATYTQVLFNGGWAERFLGAFWDAGASAVAWCHIDQPEVRHQQVVMQTLKAIR